MDFEGRIRTSVGKLQPKYGFFFESRRFGLEVFLVDFLVRQGMYKNCSKTLRKSLSRTFHFEQKVLFNKKTH